MLQNSTARWILVATLLIVLAALVAVTFDEPLPTPYELGNSGVWAPN